MSDETAFLAALKANPADDTARLVYADWLDEHDEPQKAAYLRRGGVSERASTESERLAGRGTNRSDRGALPTDWRLATAARFTLVLDSFEPTQKIQAIKVVREMTGMGLAEAKYFVEKTPSRFPLRLTPESADALRRYFAHGRVRLDCESFAVGPPQNAAFGASASLTPTVAWDEEDLSVEARETFRGFLVAALGLSHDQMIGWASDALSTPLATQLTYDQLQSELIRWRTLLPANDPARNWEIRLHVHPQLSSN